MIMHSSHFILHYVGIMVVFATIMIVELLITYYQKKHVYYWQDSLANFAVLFIRSLLKLFIINAITLELLQDFTFYDFNLVGSLNKACYWGLLIIGQDFFYYWSHRYSHECRWGWASHIVHHSSNYLNYTTAVREGITALISGNWIFFLPLSFIGFAPKDIIIASGINLTFQFFLHTRLVGKLGLIEYFFNTPSNHRVHHARNEEYIDKNYGGILIVWDRVFGSYTRELNEPEYGLVHQHSNYNPIYIFFHGWFEMFNDVIKYKNLKYFILFPK